MPQGLMRYGIYKPSMSSIENRSVITENITFGVPGVVATTNRKAVTMYEQTTICMTVTGDDKL